jgi:hypothetical protein
MPAATDKPGVVRTVWLRPTPHLAPVPECARPNTVDEPIEGQRHGNIGHSYARRLPGLAAAFCVAIILFVGALSRAAVEPT